MKVVIDTNVMIMSLPSKPPYHPIIKNFIAGNYDLVLTTEIFLEYEEILITKSNPKVAFNILNAFIDAPNIVVPEIFFNWNLIKNDADDNKFIDAYIAAGTDYLVTNDVHFNEVKNLSFPKINIISADEFVQIIQSLST